MSNRNSQKTGYGKLLEAWETPDHAGAPLGCVATSFTFTPDFFEEECLGRFLAVETTPEDGSAYLVEREEKLAQVYAAALVDQRHARGKRSLRWDLLAARVPNAILHAKVSLLLWTQHARLVVASANLTPNGYRQNHEVFGVLDYFPDGESPLSVLKDMVAFLRDAAKYAASESANDSPAITRWNGFLDRVLKATRNWGARHQPRQLSQPRVFAVVTGPRRPNVLKSVASCWQDGHAPNEAYVVSPFFDPPAKLNTPARELWKLLLTGYEASLYFDVVGEDLPDGGVLLHAPESLKHSQPEHREGEATFFWRLKLEEGRELHAKCLWLENESWLLYLMGSSNFTTAGLGLGRAPNLEANLAYCVCHSKNSKALDALKAAWLESSEAPRKARLLTEPQDDSEDSAIAGEILLPAAFGTATYSAKSPDSGYVELTFAGDPPLGWQLLDEDSDEIVFDERQWKSLGKPARARLDWKKDRPPSAFRVRWRGSKGDAWWLVNVSDTASLPPPSELRNLSLDDLLAILTSARPLHQVMKSVLQRRASTIDANVSPMLDPHKRVDTSAFLLQRTRRISWALEALRERLSKPVPSRETLHWRLRGPHGVMALVNAIRRDTLSEQEKSFLLTEIAVELARVRPEKQAGCLPRREVRAALRYCVREIRGHISADAIRKFPAMKSYIRRAFKGAKK